VTMRAPWESRRAGDAQPHRRSIPPEYFEERYAASADPWRLAERWYEQRKYALTLASLPRPRYASCYEPACSIGELTLRLAERCDRLLAVDATAAAVATAAARTAHLPHVRVERAALPDDLPDQTFDLVVLSEFLYYFALPDLERVVEGVVDRLRPGGHLVCVHHRSASAERWDGFNTHQAVVEKAGLARLAHHDDVEFVLDVLEAP